MRRIIFTASILVLLPLSARGQETPGVELFGGYSYFHTEGRENLHGWNASVSANLNRWFGLVADFSGHYDSTSSRSTIIVLPGSPPGTLRFESKQNFHTIMIGPRFSFRKYDKITPFAHILVGGTRRHSKNVAEAPGFTLSSFSDNQTVFAGAIGAGLDVKMSRSLALRLVQADYLVNHSFGSFQHNVRLSTGLVFRFGGK
ncbi:MAG TPA: outer membrane beta-barrel protein [Blastocatellia bacterium]|nr:outer membrane beta-barrel protein [Blastocatellia bacterium]